MTFFVRGSNLCQQWDVRGQMNVCKVHNSDVFCRIFNSCTFMFMLIPVRYESVNYSACTYVWSVTQECWHVDTQTQSCQHVLHFQSHLSSREFTNFVWYLNVSSRRIVMKLDLNSPRNVKHVVDIQFSRSWSISDTDTSRISAHVLWVYVVPWVDEICLDST